MEETAQGFDKGKLRCKTIHVHVWYRDEWFHLLSLMLIAVINWITICLWSVLIFSLKIKRFKKKKRREKCYFSCFDRWVVHPLLPVQPFTCLLFSPLSSRGVPGWCRELPCPHSCGSCTSSSHSCCCCGLFHREEEKHGHRIRVFLIIAHLLPLQTIAAESLIFCFLPSWVVFQSGSLWLWEEGAFGFLAESRNAFSRFLPAHFKLWTQKMFLYD